MAANSNQICYGQTVSNSVNALLGVMSTLITSIQEIENNSKKIVEIVDYTKKIIEHFHDSHDHAYPHDGQEKYDVPIGRTFIRLPITPADLLIQEYNTNFDSDYNGLIYGKDFKLTQNTVPRLLERINDLLDIKIQLTLDQYINTIPNSKRLWQ